MSKVKELREQRAKLVADAQALDVTKVEERAKAEKMLADSDELKAQISLIERAEAADAEMRATVMPRLAQPGVETKADDTEAVKAAYRTYMQYGELGLSAEQRTTLRQAEQRANFDTATGNGGYFIPVAFSNEFDKALKLWGGMQQVANTHKTAAGNLLYWPLEDDTSNAATLVAEGSGPTAANPTLARLSLNAYKYNSLVTVTREMMQDSAFDVEGYVRDAFAIRFGRAINTAATTGTGTGQPKGVVPCVSSALTTASPTAITYTEVVNFVHSVDPAYRKNASLMVSDSGLQALRLIMDGYSHPIFQVNPLAGAPDTILGYPVVINQDLDAVAATKIPAVFGDFSKYVIRMVNGLEVQRLNERYAELGIVGFYGVMRFDANLATASTVAIKKLTMHA